MSIECNEQESKVVNSNSNENPNTFPSVPVYGAESRAGSRLMELIYDARPASNRFKPKFIKILAPMVRYSKLPFRLLCRKWGADVTYTPMIIAEAFNRSEFARDSEFSTALNFEDRPLIAQFGADKPKEFADAAEKCFGLVDAVDLNCGCPQRWAMQSGIGAALSSKPESVSEMIKGVLNRLPNNSMCVTIKIRIMDDLNKTVELIKRAEKQGVSFITIHGRTPKQRSEPVNIQAIKFLKSVASVPIMANGDLFSADDMNKVFLQTNVDGCMTARGALSNPSLFSNVVNMPIECAVDYLELAIAYGGKYSIHHHHLLYMMYGLLTKGDRREFSTISSLSGVIDFFEERGWWPPKPHRLHLEPEVTEATQPENDC